MVKGGLAYLQASMSAKPDSPAAGATVDRVRAAVAAIPGAHAKVGGPTAINQDVQRYATRDRNLIIPLVLLVVLAILGLLLRAVIAPLLLTGTVIMSFGAALGLSALAFRHLFGFAGADTALPLYAFVFLVALGIDYNIFLMTRIREEAARSGTCQGAITGLAATGGVITSAGIGARSHVRRARHPAPGAPHRDRLHRRHRRPARHPHRPISTGHRPHHRHRTPDVVAQPPHQFPRGTDRHDRASHPSPLNAHAGARCATPPPAGDTCTAKTVPPACGKTTPEQTRGGRYAPGANACMTIGTESAKKAGRDR